MVLKNHSVNVRSWAVAVCDSSCSRMLSCLRCWTSACSTALSCFSFRRSVCSCRRISSSWLTFPVSVEGDRSPGVSMNSLPLVGSTHKDSSGAPSSSCPCWRSVRVQKEATLWSSNARAASTRWDQSNPAAVSGSGIRPGSAHLDLSDKDPSENQNSFRKLPMLGAGWVLGGSVLW